MLNDLSMARPAESAIASRDAGVYHRPHSCSWASDGADQKEKVGTSAGWSGKRPRVGGLSRFGTCRGDKVNLSLRQMEPSQSWAVLVY